MRGAEWPLGVTASRQRSALLLVAAGWATLAVGLVLILPLLGAVIIGYWLANRRHEHDHGISLMVLGTTGMAVWVLIGLGVLGVPTAAIAATYILLFHLVPAATAAAWSSGYDWHCWFDPADPSRQAFATSPGGWLVAGFVPVPNFALVAFLIDRAHARPRFAGRR